MDTEPRRYAVANCSFAGPVSDKMRKRTSSGRLAKVGRNMEIVVESIAGLEFVQGEY